MGPTPNPTNFNMTLRNGCRVPPHPSQYESKVGMGVNALVGIFKSSRELVDHQCMMLKPQPKEE